MTTETLKRDAHIIEVLEKTMELYRKAIKMDFEKQEKLVLHYTIKALENKSECMCIVEACKEILEKYPEGMPHDSTLIEEAKKLVKYPYTLLFPQTSFDKDILIYKMYDALIKDLFDTIPKEGLERREQFIIERLLGGVHSTLVDNPNFKGDNPYYKRHPYDMEQSKKLSLEILDKDFMDYIEYFKEDADD